MPEAARLLRPGGRLVFMCTSTLLTLCTNEAEEPVGERLERPQFGLHRLAWSDGGVEFAKPHGERIRLLRAHGFEIEALHEIQAPAGAVRHAHYDYVSPEWARRWPSEEIWAARKRA